MYCPPERLASPFCCIMRAFSVVPLANIVIFSYPYRATPLLLQVRKKTAAEVAEEEELLKKEADKMASQGDGGEEDAFLQDFVGNRRWLDPHSKETPR